MMDCLQLSFWLTAGLFLGLALVFTEHPWMLPRLVRYTRYQLRLAKLRLRLYTWLLTGVALLFAASYGEALFTLDWLLNPLSRLLVIGSALVSAWLTNFWILVCAILLCSLALAWPAFRRDLLKKMS
ncbi:hypothetical protein [Armatimonas rosea]|uniref:Uncharacterized protein n=1 Tax=Armatimonas rosea TaxID=685828 RepID=A0A7W9W6B2_ARMRO|nr:hypothetical protein [Armatimonas rosea]MBB6050403.1 hypothetical protein [Armatimonas rosea]